MEKPSARLILVGNAPSSGSTLLADIIDSAPFTACGPELEFFCNRNLCNFSEFQVDPTQSSYSMTLRSTRIETRWDHLKAYGYTKDAWIGSIKSASNITDFSREFVSHFLNFREKDGSGYVFEKTPQNVNNFRWFAQTFPESKMIYLVRNPAFVIDSLLKRGWGRYTAAATWLINVAIIWPFRDHPQFISLKYEDLVDAPFEKVSRLIELCCEGRRIEPSDLSEAYKKNRFRVDNAKHLDSWTTTSDREVGNANKKELTKRGRALMGELLHMKVSKEYAEAYDLPEVTMREALEYFGYLSDFEQRILPTDKNVRISKSRNDYVKLVMKGIRSIFRGDGIKKANAPFRALESCKLVEP